MIRRQLASLVWLSLVDLRRRKDLFVLLIFAFVVMAPLAMIKPFGVEGASRYLNEVAMALIWLFSLIIALSISARLFPAEFEARTIYPLLARPLSRGTLLMGKYLGALAASASALALFYMLYGLMTGLRQGVWFPPMLFQAFAMHAGLLVMVVAIGLLGSLLVTPGANLTLSGIVLAAMLLFGRRLPTLAVEQPAPLKAIVWLLHAVGPHAEFFDMRQRLVHDWPMISWSVCALVWAYALVYAGACLLLASAALRRRKF
ncbi:MAG: ABC transporter permease [Kiritimatiellia bacterium]|jgi:Cu-processing system permease protein